MSSNTKKDILEATIGEFGKWQMRISLCMALLKFPIAWFQLGIVFLAPPTNFWCRAPEDFRATSLTDWLKLITVDGSESNFKEATIPNCFMKNFELPTANTLVPCRWGYEYNRTIIQQSIITEWNLVCGRATWVDLAQMTLMLGVFLGNFIFGITADKYGRKKTLMFCIFVQSICGIFSAWAPWFELFLVIRFLMALANGGTMIVSFVLCMEIVGGRWRSVVAILYQIPFGIGNAVMAGLAYRYRDWRELQLALSSFSTLFIFYIWIVPESPRWLLATGKRNEAARILEKAAVYNDLNLTKVRKEFLTLPTLQISKNPTITSIIKAKQLRTRTFLLALNWLMNGITIFGFSQYMGHVGSNIYFTVTVGGLVVIPGTLLCVYIVKKCGRRWTIACSSFFICLCFLAILLVPAGRFWNDWPKIAFGGLGVVGLSIASPALYLFTGELYPTVVRNVGVGCTLMFCRIGSMISPFLISLQTYNPYIPLIAFSTCALFQGLIVLLLPETNGILVDTIEEECAQRQINNNNDPMKGNYTPVPKREIEAAS